MATPSLPAKMGTQRPNIVTPGLGITLRAWNAPMSAAKQPLPGWPSKWLHANYAPRYEIKCFIRFLRVLDDDGLDSSANLDASRRRRNGCQSCRRKALYRSSPRPFGGGDCG